MGPLEPYIILSYHTALKSNGIKKNNKNESKKVK